MNTLILSTMDSPFVAVAFIFGLIAVVAIVIGSITKILTTRAREQTRREIAAYVAEGTIEPDKGIEMMRAGRAYEEAMGDLYSGSAEAKAAKAAAKAEKKAAKVAAVERPQTI